MDKRILDVRRPARSFQNDEYFFLRVRNMKTEKFIEETWRKVRQVAGDPGFLEFSLLSPSIVKVLMKVREIYNTVLRSV